MDEFYIELERLNRIIHQVSEGCLLLNNSEICLDDSEIIQYFIDNFPNKILQMVLKEAKSMSEEYGTFGLMLLHIFSSLSLTTRTDRKGLSILQSYREMLGLGNALEEVTISIDYIVSNIEKMIYTRPLTDKRSLSLFITESFIHTLDQCSYSHLNKIHFLKINSTSLEPIKLEKGLILKTNIPPGQYKTVLYNESFTRSFETEDPSLELLSRNHRNYIERLVNAHTSLGVTLVICQKKVPNEIGLKLKENGIQIIQSLSLHVMNLLVNATGQKSFSSPLGEPKPFFLDVDDFTINKAYSRVGSERVLTFVIQSTDKLDLKELQVGVKACFKCLPYIMKKRKFVNPLGNIISDLRFANCGEINLNAWQKAIELAIIIKRLKHVL